MSEQKKTGRRDSKSGEFVKKTYADKHPATTERERVRVVKPGKAK